MSKIRRGKALEIACWVVGTAVITLYFDARHVGEIEREQGIGAFGQARARAVTAYPNFVTPESFAWPEFPPLDAESVPVSFPPERVDFPVFADTSERNLNWASGWVEGADTPSLLATETAEGNLVTCYPLYFAGHAPQRYIICAIGDWPESRMP